MQRLLLIVLVLVAGGIATNPACAFQDTAVTVRQPGEQFYVLSFTDAPVPEVTEAVIGGALNEPFSVDPAVDGAVDFKVEGWFNPDALLQEFGSVLLDQDAALVRNSDRSLAVVARANLPFAVARGASLVTLPEVASRPPATALASPQPVIIYGQDRWWDGAWGKAALFLGGLGTGAATVIGAEAVMRSRRALSVTRGTPLMLERWSSEPIPADGRTDGDDLVIPAFETRRPMSPPS